MIRVYAKAVVTLMANHHSFGNLPKMQSPREAVCSHHFAVNFYSPIAIFDFCSSPGPAVSSDEFPKPILGIGKALIGFRIFTPRSKCPTGRMAFLALADKPLPVAINVTRFAQVLKTAFVSVKELVRYRKIAPTARASLLSYTIHAEPPYRSLPFPRMFPHRGGIALHILPQIGGVDM